ncbi:MAG: hypothetical protein LQ338_005940 [Usnochroma carphineum]|nr:MAG: hypothetical protein LQ338_005940 [Usnochroma carphineum]
MEGYPESINMRPAATSDDGHVLSLVYTDSWGDQQYILEMEGLCSRPGCQCLHGRVICANFQDVFFEQALHDTFFAVCVARCSCTAFYERRIFDHNPSAGSETEDLVVGDLHMIHERGRPPNTVTRNNPTGSALGGAGCLKGEAAGWTLWNWRLTKCCSDTTFKALSAQEAYALYGVAPFSSDIITSHVTIGVCLETQKSIPQRDVQDT